MKLKTNKNDAVKDIAKALKDVFGKYSYSSRKSAWEALEKGKGKKAIEKILIHPSGSTASFNNLSFKEWLLKN